MLSLFLFFNLFLHVIYFSYYKIEATTYIYRLTVISLIFCIANYIHNIILLTSDYSLTLFNDSLRLNTTIFTQEAFIALIAIILLISFRDYKFKQEFFLFVFGHIVSANFLLESYNFIMLFISWEFFNLSIYIMIVGNGVKKQHALSASLKYFLLSAFSTAFLLLALTMIYHITGSLEFEPVYLAMQNNSIDLPVILIIFALIFKLGAAPLHFWAPDLYDSTPLPVTAIISTLPKIVYLLLLTNLADFLYGQFNFFMIAGFLSLIVGTIGLSQQFKIKRFLAFSSITNVGY
jgi:NADH-quinone oxidoreductase subunit N